jgi:hypothetical protein
MGLEIHRADPGRLAMTDRGTSTGLYEVPRHLWRTKDGGLVESGHPDAERLAYARGDQIPIEKAVAEGLVPADALPAAEVPTYPPDAAAGSRQPAKKASAKRKQPGGPADE